MNKKFDWLNKKTPRAIDQLRLWPENPRLNPDESHLTLNDFAEDLTNLKADRDDFFDLVSSIAEDGFVPADPVVVWKNKDNNKYYVAEGNRRLVALKLLRSPNKAPKNIRGFIRKASEKIDLNEIEKIPVNVAPSFDEAEWYINQRNSSSSLQRRWSRVQQQRWIVTLYEKHNGDIDKIISITKLTKGQLEGFFRILKIKDFVKIEDVKSKLTENEFEQANSYRFPITILERFFNFSEVKEKWGIEFDGINVKIISVKSSFYCAFAELIKRIVNNNDDKIDTRLNKDELTKVLDSLPKVVFPNNEEHNIGTVNKTNTNDTSSDNTDEQKIDSEDNDESNNSSQDTDNQQPDSSASNNHTNTSQQFKNNPDRNRLVLNIYSINTTSTRLKFPDNYLRKKVLPKTFFK